MGDPLTMTNDEAQDFLASMCKPEDAGRLGAAIRGIRAKAIADAKAWYGTDDDMDPQRLAQALHATGLNTIGRKAGSHGAYTDTCICNPDAAEVCIAYRGVALRSTPAAPQPYPGLTRTAAARMRLAHEDAPTFDAETVRELVATIDNLIEAWHDDAAPHPDAGSLRDAISALPRYSPVDTGDLIGGLAERPLGGWVQRSAVLDALAAAPRDTVTVERLARPNWSVAPGEVLREWFTERGITQSEVAARMGVAPPEVSKLVNGHDRITPRQALALERACGINADVLARMQVDYDLHALRALGESPNPTTEDAP